ncbi:MAG TPA: ABC transporter ATP-binding protein [Aliidongia sp.]|nr:ABC transporter ATP-binding protein [Aliidongia sp.]
MTESQVPTKRPSPLSHDSLRLWRRLTSGFLRPHIGKLVAAGLCMVIVASAKAANVWLTGQALRHLLAQSGSGFELYMVAAAVFGTAVVTGFATYFQSILMTTLGQRLVADIQVRLFERLIRADLAYFHGTPSGQLISRFTNDANMLRNAATQSLVAIGRDALSVVFLVAMMFYQDWLLAVIAFIFFPCAVLPVRRMSRRMRKASINFQEEMGHFNTLLSQVFQGARHVKAYGMEAHETARAVAVTERVYRLVEKVSRVRAASSPIMESLGGVAVASIILYGGYQVMAGARTPDQLLAFIVAMLLAYQPFKSLAGLQVNLQEGLAAASRIFEVMDIEPRIKDRADARPLAITGGHIRFEHVRFGYGPGTAALDGIDLDIPAGQTVALVGPSGAGKSTVLNLIPRFYDVEGGQVTIDGMDVRDATLASLRGAIGLVSQEISLFDDTIRGNIGYGRPSATEAEIVAAARAAAAHDFITELPQGYDTLVGEHGIRLSGGQRQRLAIARAMLKDAPILLLDEATSALDTESERQVQDALRRLATDRTTLVIAHRLSTIADADLIYVVDQGKVAECGRHAELLARRGLYARLWEMQFAEEAPAEQAPGAGAPDTADPAAPAARRAAGR